MLPALASETILDCAVSRMEPSNCQDSQTRHRRAEFRAILKKIEAEILSAPKRKQESMNCCLGKSAATFPNSPKSAWTLGSDSAQETHTERLHIDLRARVDCRGPQAQEVIQENAMIAGHNFAHPEVREKVTEIIVEMLVHLLSAARRPKRDVGPLRAQLGVTTDRRYRNSRDALRDHGR
jgi:hypothetical protein